MAHREGGHSLKAQHLMQVNEGPCRLAVHLLRATLGAYLPASGRLLVAAWVASSQHLQYLAPVLHLSRPSQHAADSHRDCQAVYLARHHLPVLVQPLLLARRKSQ